MPSNQYETLMRHVWQHGSAKSDRTGTGTRSVFGYQMRFDLSAGFPLVTTKKVHLKSIIYELLWFLQGSGNNNWLRERGVTIWDEWAKENGDLGPVYGVQWRSWPAADGRHIDQISEVIHTLKSNPDSRRIIVSHMVAQQCDLAVGDFIWTGGDCHIYDNHQAQVQEQLARTPYPYPKLRIKRQPADIFSYEFDDFEVLDYQHHPAIKAPVAV